MSGLMSPVTDPGGGLPLTTSSETVVSSSSWTGGLGLRGVGGAGLAAAGSVVGALWARARGEAAANSSASTAGKPRPRSSMNRRSPMALCSRLMASYSGRRCFAAAIGPGVQVREPPARTASVSFRGFACTEIRPLHLEAGEGHIGAGALASREWDAPCTSSQAEGSCDGEVWFDVGDLRGCRPSTRLRAVGVGADRWRRGGSQRSLAHKNGCQAQA